MKYQMPCADWAEMLAVSHPEEDLSPSECYKLEAHLAQCVQCAAVRKRYTLMSTRVRALPSVRPLLGFTPALLERRENKVARTEQMAPRSLPWPKRKKEYQGGGMSYGWIGGGLVALLLILAAVVLFQPSSLMAITAFARGVGPYFVGISIVVFFALAILIGVLSRWRVHVAFPSPSPQNRTSLLQRLQHIYRDLLTQSLQGVAQIELELVQQTGAVLTAAHLPIRLPDQSEHDLFSGTSILQVYMEAQGKLLILGEPGAGKSTLLLSLAQQLVQGAKDDATQPLPVILPLSSWAIKRQPLQKWCSKQVEEIYHVPRQVCEQWMQHGQILLLLDGLDEVEEDARPACIAAINAYYHEYMMPLVVCSRDAEYTNASKHQRLALQSTFIVQPLTKEQVDRHLARVGVPMAALRSAFLSDPALQELATTPLMLNVLMLTYQGTAAPNLSTKGAALRQQVLGTYVQRMVERKGNTKLYPLGRTRLWLGWLAMLITACIVLLLIAIGIVGVLIIPKTPAKLAMGTLLYTYHTVNKGIYDTYVNGVAWSPDGQYIACATGDGAVVVLKPATQQEVFVYRGHHGWVNNVVWFPDGKRIASVSSDHTVQIWGATTGRNVSTFTGSSSLWAVAVSPDGNTIAYAGKDGVVQVWQVSPKIHIYTYTGQARAGGIWGLAFSPDGKQIASGDSSGAIQVWDATNGGHVLTYSDHTKQIYDLKWSPDGQYIASASADGTIRVWNASSGSTIYIHRFSSAVMQAVSWSPDGKRIASASANGTVQVWDAFDGNHLFVYHHHSGAVFTIAWSPDGSRIASGDESGSLQIWEAG
jgi:Tol biopolymer transport system component